MIHKFSIRPFVADKSKTGGLVVFCARLPERGGWVFVFATVLHNVPTIAEPARRVWSEGARRPEPAIAVLAVGAMGGASTAYINGNGKTQRTR